MATVTCPGCLQRDAEIADLKRRLAHLEALVRDLTARLGTNATHLVHAPFGQPAPGSQARYQGPPPASGSAPNPGTPPTSSGASPGKRGHFTALLSFSDLVA